MKILVVDDERLSRMMLEDSLRGWGHEVVSAADGREAWERIRADPELSLVISDWVMPGVDGPELCRRVRALDRSPYLPIVLNTGLEEDEHLAQGLGAGADAFLTKPLRPPALRAQLQVIERILQLEESLQTRVRSLEEANERIHRDLAAAAEVQRSHLPRKAPQVPLVEFAWVYDACQDLGGDMFNVLRLDETHVGVYVLDVSGHGTPAALLSVSLSRALVADSQQGGILKRPLPEPPWYEIVGPAEVAAELNRRFPIVEESGRFCTLLYGVLDVEHRSFRYTAAGHAGPIQIWAGTGHGAECALRPLEAVGGVPIGVLPDAEYAEEEIRLGCGSQLLLYTDGVNEARSKRGEEFGRERLLETLAGALERPEPGGVRSVVTALQERLADFAGGAEQRDDITIVGVGLA